MADDVCASGSAGGCVPLSGAAALGSGDHHSCTILVDGSAVCWGGNWAGQLGNGSGSPQPNPVPVLGLVGGQQTQQGIDGGEAHTCVVTTLGTVRCWGDASAAGAGASLGNSITSPDPADGVFGSHTSITLDGSGNPVVSYYSSTDDTLKVLHCDDANCAGGGESVTIPDGDPDNVGRWNSLVLDDDGYPVVSYYNNTDNSLKVMHCNDPNCEGSDEQIETPESSMGLFTSLVLDASGNPVVSYGSNDILKLMHCNDPNCQGSDEKITTVDTVGSAEPEGHTSLVLDASGNPVISYYNNSSDDLKLMHCNDPDCEGSDENIVFVDTGGDVGVNGSLALDSNGNPVVAYYDRTNGQLRVVHCNDPNCQGGNESITTPDVSGGDGPSLVLDSTGNPVISYYDGAELRVMHCNDPGCSGTNEIIETPHAPLTGQYSSLVLDASGNPVLSYKNISAQKLNLLHCSNVNCAGLAPTLTKPTPTPSDTPTLTPTPTPTEPIPPKFDALLAKIDGLEDHPPGLKISLKAKVNTSKKLVQLENPCAAANVMSNAFVNQVKAATPRRIPTEIANALVDQAEAISSQLDAGGSCNPGPDTDQDQVHDSAESTLGTDPAEEDTDSDGLLDGHELLDVGSDPLDPDTDDNGTDDGEEDQDADGCTVAAELGTDPLLGGQRDWLNPHDFYDVLGGGGGPPDQIIDLTNDIFEVIQHYAPTGSEPEYDIAFDRGPSVGPNVWNMTAPDGVIDLTNDILGVILQYLHSCQ